MDTALPYCNRLSDEIEDAVAATERECRHLPDWTEVRSVTGRIQGFIVAHGWRVEHSSNPDPQAFGILYTIDEWNAVEALLEGK